VRRCLDRGLKIDDFAPRLSFFFNCHNDFFEEVAKFRAARRIWAREMRETYGAKDPRSWWMRFHTQTAGVSLTAQQPEVNLVRTTIQALAAVLGGTQSLHTNSMDEALALPSEKAATLALRTQQVIAHESGAANTVDPLGGSYFVETLTDETEDEAYAYFRKIDDLGGVVRALESGFLQREIADASYRYQRETDAHERVIVGVNEYVANEPLGIPILEMDPAGEERQIERLRRTRRERDGRAATAALRALEAACRDGTNVMPPLLDAANAYCTLGEMCDVMRQAFGSYQESAVI
jgi:methylmalonyl-CoA mutase N-terminal domain/subunit